jgi:hypothetical protein
MEETGLHVEAEIQTAIPIIVESVDEVPSIPSAVNSTDARGDRRSIMVHNGERHSASSLALNRDGKHDLPALQRVGTSNALSAGAEWPMWQYTPGWVYFYGYEVNYQTLSARGEPQGGVNTMYASVGFHCLCKDDDGFRITMRLQDVEISSGAGDPQFRAAIQDTETALELFPLTFYHFYNGTVGAFEASAAESSATKTLKMTFLGQFALPANRAPQSLSRAETDGVSSARSYYRISKHFGSFEILRQKTYETPSESIDVIHGKAESAEYSRSSTARITVSQHESGPIRRIHTVENVTVDPNSGADRSAAVSILARSSIELVKARRLEKQSHYLEESASTRCQPGVDGDVMRQEHTRRRLEEACPAGPEELRSGASESCSKTGYVDKSNDPSAQCAGECQTSDYLPDGSCCPPAQLCNQQRASSAEAVKKQCSAEGYVDKSQDATAFCATDECTLADFAPGGMCCPPTKKTILLRLVDRVQTFFKGADGQQLIAGNLVEKATEGAEEANGNAMQTRESPSGLDQLKESITRMVDLLLDNVLAFDIKGVLTFLEEGIRLCDDFIAGRAKYGFSESATIEFDKDHVLAPIFEKVKPLIGVTLKAAKAVHVVLQQLKSLILFPMAGATTLQVHAFYQKANQVCGVKVDIDFECPYLTDDEISEVKRIAVDATVASSEFHSLPGFLYASKDTWSRRCYPAVDGLPLPAARLPGKRIDPTDEQLAPLCDRAWKPRNLEWEKTVAGSILFVITSKDCQLGFLVQHAQILGAVAVVVKNMKPNAWQNDPQNRVTSVYYGEADTMLGMRALEYDLVISVCALFEGEGEREGLGLGEGEGEGEEQASPTYELKSHRIETQQLCFERCIRRQEAFKGIERGLFKIVTSVTSVMEKARQLYDCFKDSIVPLGQTVAETIFNGVLAKFNIFEANWEKTIGDPKRLAVSAFASVQVDFDTNKGQKVDSQAVVETGATMDLASRKAAMSELGRAYLKGGTLTSPTDEEEQCLKKAYETMFDSAPLGQEDVETATAVALAVDSSREFEKATVEETERSGEFVTQLQELHERAQKAKPEQRGWWKDLLASSVTARLSAGLGISALSYSQEAIKVAWEPSVHMSKGFDLPMPELAVLGTKVPFDINPQDLLVSMAVNVGTNLMLQVVTDERVHYHATHALLNALRDPAGPYGGWLRPPPIEDVMTSNPKCSERCVGFTVRDFDKKCKHACNKGPDCEWMEGGCAFNPGRPSIATLVEAAVTLLPARLPKPECGAIKLPLPGPEGTGMSVALHAALAKPEPSFHDAVCFLQSQLNLIASGLIKDASGEEFVVEEIIKDCGHSYLYIRSCGIMSRQQSSENYRCPAGMSDAFISRSDSETTFCSAQNGCAESDFKPGGACCPARVEVSTSINRSGRKEREQKMQEAVLLVTKALTGGKPAAFRIGTMDKWEQFHSKALATQVLLAETDGDENQPSATVLPTDRSYKPTTLEEAVDFFMEMIDHQDDDHPGTMALYVTKQKQEQPEGQFDFVAHIKAIKVREPMLVVTISSTDGDTILLKGVPANLKPTGYISFIVERLCSSKHGDDIDTMRLHEAQPAACSAFVDKMFPQVPCYLWGAQISDAAKGCGVDLPEPETEPEAPEPEREVDKYEEVYMSIELGGRLDECANTDEVTDDGVRILTSTGDISGEYVKINEPTRMETELRQELEPLSVDDLKERPSLGEVPDHEKAALIELVVQKTAPTESASQKSSQRVQLQKLTKEDLVQRATKYYTDPAIRLKAALVELVVQKEAPDRAVYRKKGTDLVIYRHDLDSQEQQDRAGRERKRDKRKRKPVVVAVWYIIREQLVQADSSWMKFKFEDVLTKTGKRRAFFRAYLVLTTDFEDPRHRENPWQSRALGPMDNPEGQGWHFICPTKDGDIDVIDYWTTYDGTVVIDNKPIDFEAPSPRMESRGDAFGYDDDDEFVQKRRRLASPDSRTGTISVALAKEALQILLALSIQRADCVCTSGCPHSKLAAWPVVDGLLDLYEPVQEFIQASRDDSSAHDFQKLAHDFKTTGGSPDLSIYSPRNRADCKVATHVPRGYAWCYLPGGDDKQACVGQKYTPGARDEDGDMLAGTWHLAKPADCERTDIATVVGTHGIDGEGGEDDTQGKKAIGPVQNLVDRLTWYHDGNKDVFATKTKQRLALAVHAGNKIESMLETGRQVILASSNIVTKVMAEMKGVLDVLRGAVASTRAERGGSDASGARHFEPQGGQEKDPLGNLRDLFSEDGFRSHVAKLRGWIELAFNKACSDVDKNGKSMYKDVEIIHAAGRKGLAPELLETILFFPKVAESAASVWAVVEHIVTLQEEAVRADPKKWLAKLLRSEERCEAAAAAAGDAEGEPVDCTRIEGEGEVLSDACTAAGCTYMPATPIKCTPSCNGERLTCGDDALLVRSIDKLANLAESLSKSHTMREGYVSAAVTMMLDVLGRVEGLANMARALLAAPEAAEMPAPKTTSFLIRKQKAPAPEYVKCPRGGEPTNVQMTPLGSFTRITVVPELGIVIPVMGVPIMLSIEVLADFMLDLETASCTGVPVPGSFIEKVGKNGKNGKPPQTRAWCSHNFECYSGKCRALTPEDEIHQKLSQESDQSAEELRVLVAAHMKKWATDLQKTLEQLTPLDFKKRAQVNGITSAFDSKDAQIAQVVEREMQRPITEGAKFCTSCVLDADKCAHTKHEKYTEQVIAHAAAPTLSAIVYTEFKVGVGVPMLSIGVFGRIRVVDFRLPFQITVAPAQNGVTGSISVVPRLGALSGSIGVYGKVWGHTFSKSLFEWEGFATELPGYCKQIPAWDKSQQRKKPLPVLCPVEPVHRATTVHGHEADPVTRPTVQRKCYPCEFRPTGFCGSWRCPLPPERYAALAGLPNLIAAIDGEWWSSSIEPDFMCWHARRKAVAAMHVCGEHVDAQKKNYRGYIVIRWKATLHQEAAGKLPLQRHVLKPTDSPQPQSILPGRVLWATLHLQVDDTNGRFKVAEALTSAYEHEEGFVEWLCGTRQLRQELSKMGLDALRARATREMITCAGCAKPRLIDKLVQASCHNMVLIKSLHNLAITESAVNLRMLSAYRWDGDMMSHMDLGLGSGIFAFEPRHVLVADDDQDAKLILKQHKIAGEEEEEDSAQHKIDEKQFVVMESTEPIAQCWSSFSPSPQLAVVQTPLEIMSASDCQTACASGWKPAMNRASHRAECVDGKQNREETGVDCGGTECTTRCRLSLGCLVDTDCGTGKCDTTDSEGSEFAIVGAGFCYSGEDEMVNGRVTDSLFGEESCRLECSALDACIGYAWKPKIMVGMVITSDSRCFLHGHGLHHNVREPNLLPPPSYASSEKFQGWYSFHQTKATIAFARPVAEGHKGTICKRKGVGRCRALRHGEDHFCHGWKFCLEKNNANGDLVGRCDLNPASAAEGQCVVSVEQSKAKDTDLSSSSKPCHEDSTISSRQCFECHFVGDFPPHSHKSTTHPSLVCPRLGSRETMRLGLLSTKKKVDGDSVFDFGVESCLRDIGDAGSPLLASLVGSDVKRESLDYESTSVHVCSEEILHFVGGSKYNAWMFLAPKDDVEQNAVHAIKIQLPLELASVQCTDHDTVLSMHHKVTQQSHRLLEDSAEVETWRPHLSTTQKTGGWFQNSCASQVPDSAQWIPPWNEDDQIQEIQVQQMKDNCYKCLKHNKDTKGKTGCGFQFGLDADDNRPFLCQSADKFAAQKQVGIAKFETAAEFNERSRRRGIEKTCDEAIDSYADAMEKMDRDGACKKIIQTLGEEKNKNGDWISGRSFKPEKLETQQIRMRAGGNPVHGTVDGGSYKPSIWDFSTHSTHTVTLQGEETCEKWRKKKPALLEYINECDANNPTSVVVKLQFSGKRGGIPLELATPKYDSIDANNGDTACQLTSIYEDMGAIEAKSMVRQRKSFKDFLKVSKRRLSDRANLEIGQSNAPVACYLLRELRANDRDAWHELCQEPISGEINGAALPLIMLRKLCQFSCERCDQHSSNRAPTCKYMEYHEDAPVVTAAPRQHIPQTAIQVTAEWSSPPSGWAAVESKLALASPDEDCTQQELSQIVRGGHGSIYRLCVARWLLSDTAPNDLAVKRTGRTCAEKTIESMRDAGSSDDINYYISIVGAIFVDCAEASTNECAEADRSALAKVFGKELENFEDERQAACESTLGCTYLTFPEAWGANPARCVSNTLRSDMENEMRELAVTFYSETLYQLLIGGCAAKQNQDIWSQRFVAGSCVVDKWWIKISDRTKIFSLESKDGLQAVPVPQGVARSEIAKHNGVQLTVEAPTNLKLANLHQVGVSGIFKKYEEVGAGYCRGPRTCEDTNAWIPRMFGVASWTTCDHGYVNARYKDGYESDTECELECDLEDACEGYARGLSGRCWIYGQTNINTGYDIFDETSSFGTALDPPLKQNENKILRMKDHRLQGIISSGFLRERRDEWLRFPFPTQPVHEKGHDGGDPDCPDSHTICHSSTAHKGIVCKRKITSEERNTATTLLASAVVDVGEIFDSATKSPCTTYFDGRPEPEGASSPGAMATAASAMWTIPSDQSKWEALDKKRDCVGGGVGGSADPIDVVDAGPGVQKLGPFQTGEKAEVQAALALRRAYIEEKTTLAASLQPCLPNPTIYAVQRDADERAGAFALASTPFPGQRPTLFRGTMAKFTASCYFCHRKASFFSMPAIWGAADPSNYAFECDGEEARRMLLDTPVPRKDSELKKGDASKEASGEPPDRAKMDLFTAVNKLTTVVHRIATTAGLLHQTQAGKVVPDYAVCDEWARHSTSTKAVTFWGGVMCSHLGMESKCIQYQIDRFLDRAAGTEASPTRDPAENTEFTLQGFVQKLCTQSSTPSTPSSTLPTRTMCASLMRVLCHAEMCCTVQYRLGRARARVRTLEDAG